MFFYVLHIELPIELPIVLPIDQSLQSAVRLQVLELAVSLFIPNFVSWTCRCGGFVSAVAVMGGHMGMVTFQKVKTLSTATDAGSGGMICMLRYGGLFVGLTL